MYHLSSRYELCGTRRADVGLESSKRAVVQLSAPARLSRPQHCCGLVWYGDCPVVLCEDMSSSSFADAKHMFLWASDESSCDKITAEVKVEHACKDLNKRLLRPQHCCGPSIAAPPAIVSTSQCWLHRVVMDQAVGGTCCIAIHVQKTHTQPMASALTSP